MDLVLLDVRLPGISGLELLTIVRENYSLVEVIVISALKEVEVAVTAMKQGAYHYITKEFDYDGLRSLVRNALERQDLSRQLITLNAQVAEQGDRKFVLGPSRAMREIVDLSQKVAQLSAIEYLDDTGRKLPAVAAPAASPEWTVIVEQPVSEAFGLSNQLERQLVIVIIVALLLTVALGYYWGRSFIRPILALTRGTEAIASGRLEERVDIGGTDELHQLGKSFNGMAAKLHELQEDVRRQERQAIFGRIAAGLVHDLSHPIQNIGNSCRLIVRLFDDHDYRATFRRTVDREFASIKLELENLRNLARPMSLERFPVDVNRSVAKVAESMQALADTAGVELVMQLSASRPFIEGGILALGRVYRNLMLNAIEATAPGGVITLSTEERDGRIQILVLDTGTGIPHDRLENIFEDFQTTKRSGLGLGLAISRKIVNELDGDISVTSTVGRGTTFSLEFARVEGRPVVPAATAAAS